MDLTIVLLGFLFQVPLLCARHEPASGGAPLLHALQPGHATVPHLRQPGEERASHRRGVHRVGEAVSGPARGREEAVAHPRVRGQGRHPLHARCPQSG